MGLMFFRRLAPLALALVLVISGLPGLALRARAAEATVVLAALAAIRANHIDTPDMLKLLAAAVGGW